MGRVLKVSCLGLGVVVLLVVVAIVAVSVSGGGGSDEPIKVVYKVTGADGANRADMTFLSSSDGSTSQQNGEQLPWTKTVTFDDKPSNVYVVIAQNRGGGELTCTVTVDGEKVASNTATGRYAIASCDKAAAL